MFNRPVEYDPSLALARSADNNFSSWEAAIKNEFGLDEEASEPDSSDAERSQEGRKAGLSDLIERLGDSIEVARRGVLRGEQAVARQEAIQDEMQREHKAEKGLLMTRHEKQKGNLREQVAEIQAQVEGEEDRLQKMKEQIARVDEGLDPKVLEASVAHATPITDVTKANKASKLKLKEVSSHAKELKQVVLDLEAERNRLEALLPDDGGVVEQEQRLAQLESERAASKAEVKTKQAERKELQTRLQELQALLAAKNGPTSSRESPLDLARKQMEADVAREEAKLVKMRTAAAKRVASVAESEQKLALAKKDASAKRKDHEQEAKATSQNVAEAAAALQASAKDKDKEIASLTKATSELEVKVASLREALQQREADMLGLKDQAKEKLNGVSDDVKRLKEDYKAAKAAHAEAKAKTAELVEEAASLDAQHRELATSGVKRKATLQALLKDLQDARKTLATLRKSAVSLPSAVEGDSAPLIKAVQSFITKELKRDSSMRANYKTEMLLRRKYFNQVQEILGNVRISIRIRPLLDGESEAQHVVKVPSEETVLVQGDTVTEHEFETKILEAASNETVFQEIVSDLIQSALDGSNVTIFAYGARGTGRTLTMQGERIAADGMFGRTAETIVRFAGDRVPDAKYNLSIAMLGASAGGLRDLSTRAVVPTVPTEEGLGAQCAFVGITDGKMALQVVEKGLSASVDAAEAVVMTVTVKGRNNILDRDIDTCINLVELPSIEDGGSDVATFESLLVAKATKKKNTKYASSTLTHYLQPQLENNAKVLVIMHLDPCKANTALKSLELATNVGGKSP